MRMLKMAAASLLVLGAVLAGCEKDIHEARYPSNQPAPSIAQR